MTTTPEMSALRMHASGDATELVYETAGLPPLGTGDVLVEVHAAGYTPGELDWPSTWVDRSGHDRTPIVPCYEVSGVVSALGFGASGLNVGDEVYGLLDWYRDGAAAQYVAAEARNLALRPRTVDHVAAAALPLAGLTAWQALYDHGGVTSGQTVAILGAAGGVGNLAVQIACHAGAGVIGLGRAHGREAVLSAGATDFIDLDRDPRPELRGVSLVLDTVGGPVAAQLAADLDDSARFVSIVDPAIASSRGARATFFVVEPDRATLRQIAELVDDGVIKPGPGERRKLADGQAAVVAKDRGEIRGKLTLQAM